LRHPDLNLLTVAAVGGALLVLIFTALVHAALIFSRRSARRLHRYPSTWKVDQIKIFERLRIVIGLGLAMTWIALQVAMPRMPVAWPFGLEAALLTMALLLLTDAWLMLVRPTNWERSILTKLGFASTWLIIAVSWTVVLGGLLLTIERVSSTKVPFHFTIGTYA